MITKQKTWQQPSTDHMLETSVKIEDIELRTVYLKKQFFFCSIKKKETMLWDDSDSNHIKTC